MMMSGGEQDQISQIYANFIRYVYETEYVARCTITEYQFGHFDVKVLCLIIIASAQSLMLRHVRLSMIMIVFLGDEFMMMMIRVMMMIMMMIMFPGDEVMKAERPLSLKSSTWTEQEEQQEEFSAKSGFDRKRSAYSTVQLYTMQRASTFYSAS